MGAVTDNADGSGSVGWTYSVPNGEIDFLGAGETVELTFTVQIDDGVAYDEPFERATASLRECASSFA